MQRSSFYKHLARYGVVLILLVAAADARSQEAPTMVVEQFIEAYNEHDVDAMLALVHPDIHWLSIDGDSISVQTKGAEQLGESMRGYFEAMPSTRSEAEAMMEAGQLVSVWERAFWQSANGLRSQNALAVYEIEDGLIRTVWYYPSQP